MAEIPIAALGGFVAAFFTSILRGRSGTRSAAVGTFAALGFIGGLLTLIVVFFSIVHPD
jgi:hypothetical protein